MISDPAQSMQKAGRTMDEFLDTAISEETRAFNRSLAAGRPDALAVPASAQALRDGYAAMTAAAGAAYRSPQAATAMVDGPSGPIALHIVRPMGRPRGAVLFLHGGGWTIGAADLQDNRLELFAQAGLTVVAPHYRLAPEHPFPAPLDDCATAARWMIAGQSTLAGAGPLFVVGESAGANLAAALALRLRDEGGGQAISAMALFYGVYDLSGTPSTRLFGDPPGMMGTSLLNWFYDNYAGNSRRNLPELSPLQANLMAMPDTLFLVGTADPLLDDTLFMSARWAAAGNFAQLHVAPGGAHGFNSYPLEIGQAANAAAVTFLTERMGSGSENGETSHANER